MASRPVERVVAFLVERGFRRIDGPLVINRMKFELPAALLGPERSNDLVLVIDTVAAEGDYLVRQVLGVARSLDIARSSNPLTTIIVGPRPHQEHLVKIMEVCRVLPLGSIGGTGISDEKVLENWLAVLTPLEPFEATGVVADPMAALEDNLQSKPDGIIALIRSAERGAPAVQDELNELIAVHLRNLLEDSE